MPKDYYTVAQVAEIYGVTVGAVYKWRERGLEPKKERRLGKQARMVFDLDDVKEFLNLGVR